MSEYDLKYTETQPGTHFGLSLGLRAFGLLPVSGFAQIRPAAWNSMCQKRMTELSSTGMHSSPVPFPYWSRGYLISRKIESFSGRERST
jgi:hypothetical protein